MKKISPYRRFRRTPVSPNVISAIRKFSAERRNAIRGALSEVERGKIFIDQIVQVRDNLYPSDMIVAGEILNGPKGLRARRVRNLHQKDLQQVHDLVPKSSQLEIAYACGFINSWAEESREATGTIKFLAQISSVDHEDSVGVVRAAAERWGSSIYISWKLGYLKSFAPNIEKIQAKLNEIDRILGHRETPLAQYSAIENLKDGMSLFAVARRHTNALIDHVEGDFRKSFVLSNLVATPFSPQDCAGFILRASETSLIDAVHALWVVLNLSDRFQAEAEAIRQYLSPEIYDDLTAARAEICKMEAPTLLSEEESTILVQEEKDLSQSLYRRAAAFLEFPTLTRYRNDLDRVIGRRLVASLVSDLIKHESDSSNDHKIIRQPDGVFDLRLHNSEDVIVDTFYRTYLFLRFIQNPMNLSSLDGEGIKFIFDHTIGLESLLLERELKTMHLNASDDARALIAVLALALYRSQSSDPDVDFDFRAKLEQHISERFNGSIPMFVSSLAPDSPQVANYIVTSLDEVTLQKMYSLISSTERADEVRREILMAIGFRLNRIEYIVEAEAIATRAKVAKIKNYFDASRMYVDSLAMRKWLSSTPSAYAEHYKELLPKITAQLSTLGYIKGVDGADQRVNLLTLSATDEHLVSQVAREAFGEFCTNNEFGIESYLGRRIRHNTLHGVMTKAVDAVTKRPEYASVIEGTPFGRAINSWGSWYKNFIERARKEFLQFKSPSNPNAIFSAEIDFSDPKTANNIGNLVNALRISGPELLHDLVVAFCWQQIGPQLESASHHIRVWMLHEVTISLEHALNKFNGPEELKIKAKLIESIASMFAQVASWFQVPQTGFVPASIADLCNIIDIEYNRASKPSFVIVDRPTVKYYGISVHRLYDCLAVLLQNAFKHGEIDTPVTVRVCSEQIGGTNFEKLEISVLSKMPDENLDHCVSRVGAAISSSETGKDMVTEGYSGIKKVKFITRLNEGAPTVTHTVVGNEIEIRFVMRAEVAIEAPVHD